MNRCSGCGYIVPGAWTECRRCGAPVAVSVGAPAQAPAPTSAPSAAAPAPISAASTLGALALAPPPPPLPPPSPHPSVSTRPDTGFGAPDDALLPGASHVAPGPDTMLPREPIITVAAPHRTRLNGRQMVVAALIGVCVIGGAFTLIPHGGNHSGASQPVILAPQPPFAGIPTSLSAIVRIEAESSRHTALGNVMDTAGPSGNAVTIAQMENAQPDYQWVPGTQPSTTNLIISIASVPGSDMIAVSGTNRSICAFGRWSPGAGATYVTMDNVKTCDAAAAPATGWSPLAGGSNQDLPDTDGS